MVGSLGLALACAACGARPSSSGDTTPLYRSARFDVRARWGAIATADLAATFSRPDDLRDLGVSIRIESKGRSLVVRARRMAVLARGRVVDVPLTDDHIAGVSSWLTREVRLPVALPETARPDEVQAVCVTWTLATASTPIFEDTATFVRHDGVFLYAPGEDVCAGGRLDRVGPVRDYAFYRADPY